MELGQTFKKQIKMIKADLYYNHYYPYYTIETQGRKKYYYFELVNIHLSQTKRFEFKLKYDNGKLSEINFEHIKDKHFDYHNKKIKYISYVDFALKMKTFENFLARGINTLREEQAYYKIMVFSEVYKFNKELELNFTYGKINLRKADIKHSIVEGKLMKPKKEYGDSDLDKVGKYLDAWDSNYKFKEISEEKFKEDLNNIMKRYIDYLAPPKVLRKKEYEIK